MTKQHLKNIEEFSNERHSRSVVTVTLHGNDVDSLIAEAKQHAQAREVLNEIFLELGSKGPAIEQIRKLKQLLHEARLKLTWVPTKEYDINSIQSLFRRVDEVLGAKS